MKRTVSILFFFLAFCISAIADSTNQEDVQTPVPQKIDVSGLESTFDTPDKVAISKLGDSQISIRNATEAKLDIHFSKKDEFTLKPEGIRIFFFDSTKAAQVKLMVSAPGKHGSTYSIDLKPNGIYSLVVKAGPQGVSLFEDKETPKPTKTAKR